MRRIAGGVAGWLAAVLPLLGVNIAGYADVFDTSTAVIAGAAALLGGILLGAVVTGLLAGRPSAKRAGGAAAALPAGIIAAALYVVSLIAVVEVAIQIQAAPAIVAAHPIRIAGAIICLGAILLGLALLVGTLTGRLPAKQNAQPAPRQSAPAPQHLRPQARYAPSASQPRRNDGYPDRGAYRDARGPHDHGEYGGYRSGQGRDGNGYNDTGYNDDRGGYDQRQPAPQRGGAPSRPQMRPPSGPTSRYGHDNDWRDARR
jgi:hypothetical protein